MLAFGVVCVTRGARAQLAPAPAHSGPPALTHLPAEQDWRYFSRTERRGAALNRMKYMPLGAGGDAYLSLGGEVRPWYHVFRNEVWGAAPTDRDGFLLQRYSLHADVHASRRVRAFVELKSGLEDGRAGGPRPVDEDRFDLNQAFLELSSASRRDVHAAGTAAAGPSTAHVRVGRQELDAGSGRMVSVREGPNVRIGWDGVRATTHADGWRVDAWGVRPLNTRPGVWDDARPAGGAFWAVYASRPIWGGPATTGDLYYMGTAKRDAHYDRGRGLGRERRHTLVVRAARAATPHATVDYDLEGAVQWGRFATDAIRAWTIAASAGYSWHAVRLAPRLGVNVGAGSGDRAPGDRRENLFVAPAARGAYFGQSTPLGPGNLVGVSPNLTLALAPGLSLRGEWYAFWRQSARDGIYDVGGQPLRTGQSIRSRFVAAQSHAEAAWQIDRHLAVGVAYAYVHAGGFLRDTPPARHITYVSPRVTLRF